jgi:hypothetical protein
MTLVPLLVALTLQTPQTLSYDCRATRVPVVLADLSAKTGRKLECELSFDNEVVLIHTDRAAVDDVLDRIAFANTAVWRKDGDRLVLTPDKVKRAEQEREVMARRVKSIQRILDGISKEGQTSYTDSFITSAVEASKHADNGEYERYTRAYRSSPLARLAMRTVASLGAQRLAAIKDGARLVLSSDPNRLQARWPGFENLMATARAEARLFSQAEQQLPDEDRSRISYMWMQTNGPHRDPDLSQAGRVWLSIGDLARDGDLPRVQIGVESADRSTRFGTTVNLQIPPEPVSPPKPSDSPDVPLMLNAESEALAQSMRVIQSDSRPPLDAEVKKKLLDPLATDPLAFGSEVMSSTRRRVA